MQKPCSRIETIYNGIDLDEVDQLREQARSFTPIFIDEIQGKKFILHLARVAPVKRPELAVQGIYEMRETFEKNGWLYLIAGDGEHMNQRIN